jgi:hypothetical protein
MDKSDSKGFSARIMNLSTEGSAQLKKIIYLREIPRFIIIITGILTGGLSFLLSYWFPSLRRKLYYKRESSFDLATHLFITDDQMNESIEPKEKEAFFYYLLKYVYDKNTNTIKPLEYSKP